MICCFVPGETVYVPQWEDVASGLIFAVPAARVGLRVEAGWAEFKIVEVRRDSLTCQGQDGKVYTVFMTSAWSTRGVEEPFSDDEERRGHCVNCGISENQRERTWINGIPFCAECEKRLPVCPQCGERITFGMTRIPEEACEGWHSCDNRECAHHGENRLRTLPECLTCYNARLAAERKALRRGNCIKAYSYKPAPVFLTAENEEVESLYYGFEIEMDSGDTAKCAPQDIARVGLEELGRVCYFKRDSSLSRGVECVTHPMSRKAAEKFFASEGWKLFRKYAKEKGFDGDRDTCGLHIHTSKEYYEKNNNLTGKMLLFFEWHWPELVKFSRRTQEDLDRWASRYRSIEETDKEGGAEEKARGEDSRYRAINLKPENTVEFRMFRGSLDETIILATLELLHALHETLPSLGWEELREMSWENWLEKFQGYPYLRKYLEKRGALNVSDDERV